MLGRHMLQLQVTARGVYTKDTVATGRTARLERVVWAATTIHTMEGLLKPWC